MTLQVRKLSPSWLLYTFCAGGVAAGFVSAYVGPGRWIGDAQVAILGVRYNTLSIILIMAPLLLVGHAVKGLLPPAVPATVDRALTQPWVRMLRRAWAVVLAWLVLGVTTHGHVFAPDIGELSVLEITTRDEHPFYANVSGFLPGGCVVERKDKRDYYYCPFDATPRDSGPISLVVAGTNHEIEAQKRALPDGGFQIGGYVADTLPGDVRAAFEKESERPLAERPLVLRPKIDRQSAARFYFGTLIVAGLGAAAFIWRDRPRARAAASVDQ